MIVKNNWIETNIADRLLDPLSKMKIHITPYEFEDVDFITASKNAANELKKYDKLYLSLSGGADSEFVCRVLHSQKVNFETIVVVTPFNANELKWAAKICSDLNIKPRIVEISEGKFLKLYRDKIYKFRGNGVSVICPYLCDEIARENNGKLITGVNIIGGDRKGSVFPGVYEGDFYSELFFGNDLDIPFHLYSLEIVNATIKAIQQNVDEAHFKSNLYGTEYRLKNNYEYSTVFLHFLIQLRNIKNINAREYLILEDRDILLEKFKRVGEKVELLIDLQTHDEFKQCC